MNMTNGKYYLGSSKNIKGRWQDHKKHLRGGYHHSVALQRAWDKYGELSFKFSILEEVPKNITLVSAEQFYLDMAKCHYNCSRVANTPSANLRKPVIQYDLKGNKLNTFESIKDAERETGVKESSISACCKRKIRKNGSKCKMAGGFLWTYKGDSPDRYEKRNYKMLEKAVNRYDLNFNLIDTYNSAAASSRYLGISKSKMYRILSEGIEYGGSLWAYEGDPIPEMKKFKRVQKICRNTGDILEEYDNCEIAAKSVGVSNGNNINAVIHGKRKSCAGYSWCYSEVK